MGVRRALYSAKRGLSDKSPLILTCVGIVGFVATVVLACRETKKADDILEDHSKCLDDLKSKVDPDDDMIYNEKDLKREKIMIYKDTALLMTKNYIPAAVCGIASITCFLYSYKILNKRYLAASALAASLSEAFLSYRGRVRERFGDEVERQLYYNTHEEVETIMDGKKEKTIVKDVMDENSIPIYAKFFDEANRQWHKDPQLNLQFLKNQEMHANDLFKIRGYLLLNEVYSMLDIPLTEIGSEVGWFESHGDDFVSFGIFNGDDERKRAFVNGYEPSILLSFNCVPKMKGDLAHA